jgi:hypothetical protein
MDKLEEFIKKNREELDRYRPSSGVWRSIRKETRGRKLSPWKWISIAAMVVIVLGTAIVLITGNYQTDNGIAENRPGKDAGVNSQLKETEVYYNNLVNSLYREATPLLTGNPEIKKELSADISHLDSICADIKKDLKDNVDNQEVVEALIQNYRIKIRLLEDMLTILKENKNVPEKKKSYGL